MTENHPYSGLDASAFWRSAVADPGLFGLRDLWKCKFDLTPVATFSTFGSCFAQHISRALVARQLNWVEAEPAPGRTPPDLARRYNYGVFSARTANIYTARQLLEWTRLAADPYHAEAIELWGDGARVRDSLRPMIEPDGFADEQEAVRMLQGAAAAFRRSIADAQVFVFTLGLTEGWENARTKQPYAACPGTLAGQFDADEHVYRNYRYPEIMAHLTEAFQAMWQMNPDLRMILTVSPVPLTATASGEHVLLATMRSKSTLRAVAADLAADEARVDYFPSYELIASPPSRGTFFEPNMRSVSPWGVKLVMEHFFAGLGFCAVAPGAPAQNATDSKQSAEDLVCEELMLEQYNAR